MFQVVLSTVLKSKLTQSEIVIATTHLKARNGALLSTLRNEQVTTRLQKKFSILSAKNQFMVISKFTQCSVKNLFSIHRVKIC